MNKNRFAIIVILLFLYLVFHLGYVDRRWKTNSDIPVKNYLTESHMSESQVQPASASTKGIYSVKHSQQNVSPESTSVRTSTGVQLDLANPPQNFPLFSNPSQNKPQQNLNLQSPLSLQEETVNTAFTEVDIAVPLGALLPAALVDSAENLNAAQVEALDQISESFIDAALPLRNAKQVDQLSVNSELVYKQTLEDADELYRALFGAEAYIAWNIRAGKEALAERP